MGKLRLALFILTLLVAFAWWMPTPGWNELSRYDLVRAIVEQHTFRIDYYHENTGDKALYEGHYYSDKAPGGALLGVPVHYVVRKTIGLVPERTAVWLLTLFTVTLPSVIGCVLLLLMLERLMPGREEWAIFLALCYALATIAYPYSTRYVGHQTAAAFLIGALYLLMNDGAKRTLRVLLAGLLMGFSLITEYPTVLLVAALAVYALWSVYGATRSPSSLLRTAAWLATGALPPVAFLLFYNHQCFGHPLTNAYSYHITFEEGMRQGVMGIGAPSLRALYGITVEPGYGLFALSPFLLISIPGMFFAVKDPGRRREGILCIAAVVLFVGFNTSYLYWHGISALGPRFLVPAVPFLVLPLTFAWRRSWALSAVAVGLVAISAFNILMGLSAALAPIPNVGPVIFGHWLAQFEVGALSPNWGTELGVPAARSVYLLIIGLAVLIGAVFLCARSSWAGLRAVGVRRVFAASGVAVAVAGAGIAGEWCIDTADAGSYRFARGDAIMGAREYLSDRATGAHSLLAKAEMELRAATDLRPDLLGAWAELAAVKVSQGNTTEAEKLMMLAGERTGRARDGYEMFVVSCLRLGGHRYAERLLRAQVAQDPNDAWSRNLLRTAEAYGFRENSRLNR